jgi:hypothetical protein
MVSTGRCACASHEGIFGNGVGAGIGAAAVRFLELAIVVSPCVEASDMYLIRCIYTLIVANFIGVSMVIVMTPLDKFGQPEPSLAGRNSAWQTRQ